MAVAMIGPKFYAWDSNGKSLAFGKLYTYEARTNIPKSTYQSEDQVVENENPVILNGEGYANIYLSGRYKMVLKDKDENEIWSSDPVSSNSADEWMNCATASYLSPLSFKISGNYTDSYTPGRKVRLDSNSANYDYSTIVSASYSAGETTVTIEDSFVKTGLVQTCASVVGPDSSISPEDIGGLTSFAFKNVQDMNDGKTQGGSVFSFSTSDIGKQVTWGGYYDAGDGGGNKGVIVDSSSISIDSGEYFDINGSGVAVKAEMTGTNFKHWGGKSGITESGNKERFDAYKAYVEAVQGRSYYFDFHNGEVYRITETIDFNFNPVYGIEREPGSSAYTFDESSIRSCIYLDGLAVSALNVAKAKDISFVGHRDVNAESLVRHTRRNSIYFDEVEIWHGGNHNLYLPYGAIPLKIKGGAIDRAKADNLFIQDQDDGQGNPDFDTNICILDAARLGYAGRHNFNWNARGGVLKITNGTDITKAGEPNGDGNDPSIGWAVRVIVQAGTRSQCVEIDNAWMEKNYNMIQLQGVLRNVNIRNIRTAAYAANSGLMLSLVGFIYDLNVSNISGSGHLYEYALDASLFNSDNSGVSTIFGNNNRINIEPTAFWASKWINETVAANADFIRRVGGFELQSYAAGTITGIFASGDDTGYNVNVANIGTGNVQAPISAQPSWFVNAGQGVDISLYVDGSYAGEISAASASSWTCQNNVSIGDGSCVLIVKRKKYDENARPGSYSQSRGFA